MAKSIKFELENKEYILEYSRNTIKKMESDKVDFETLGDTQVTINDVLFKYAFYMHHPKLSDKKIEEIYGKLGNKRGLLDALATMLTETVETLYDEPKNAVMWEVVN